MTINIPLFDKWRIKTDKYNYILFREEGEREIHEGFYSTLQGAIEGFISLKIRGFNSTSIHPLLEAIKSLQTGLNKALQPLKLRVEVGE